MKETKEHAHEVGIDPVFAKKKRRRVICVKKWFDEDVGEDVDRRHQALTYFLHILEIKILHHLRIGLSNLNFIKQSLDICIMQSSKC